VKVSKLTVVAALCAGSLCIQTHRACAQDDGPPPPPPGAPAATPAVAGPPPNPASLAPGGGGGADRMEQFRQRMNERIKTTLKASDEEWAVIQPLLNNVQEKMRETMLGRFGGGPRPDRGPGGPRENGQAGGERPERTNNAERPNRPDRPASASSAEVTALRTALESDATSNTEIKAKLEALRKSREKAVADLAQARTELKAVLNLRQEAALVMMGMLD
jgi:hypothetical protein